MNKELFDLSGKVAMVTGATRGLGEVAAKALAGAGADVAVCGRSEDDLTRVSQDIIATGQRAAGFSLDVLSGKAVRQGVEQILEHFGHVDILVNNAGINHRAQTVDYPEEQWDRVVDTNLKGYYLVTQAVAPQMLEREYGKVINISSVMGRVALPYLLAYCASKGGVDQMTRVMALEWAKLGVRVNGIGPAYFETELVAQLRDDPERFEFIKERTPMGRWGRPEELEGLVVFLAAPASDYVTGQTILIDGGWTSW